jgi:hypothetical protein
MYAYESRAEISVLGHVLCNACRKCNLKCSCGAELTKTKILHLENFQDQQDLQLRQVLHQFQ